MYNFGLSECNRLNAEQIQTMVATIIPAVTKGVVISLHEIGLIGSTTPDKQPMAADSSTGANKIIDSEIANKNNKRARL